MINVEDLVKLATSEYVDRPKYISTIQSLLLPLENLMKLNHNMSTMLNLNTAKGVSLDLIGQILGVSRQVNFQPTDPNDSPILNDDYYRLVLRAKIAKNQWDGTKENLFSIWDVLFPENPILLVDHQNMTVTVAIVGMTDQLSKDLIANGYIIPKPAGVKYDYGFTLVENPIYAQDSNTDYLKGFDEGYWLNLSGGTNV